jgi:hypothetical protein
MVTQTQLARKKDVFVCFLSRMDPTVGYMSMYFAENVTDSFFYVFFWPFVLPYFLEILMLFLQKYWFFKKY